MLVHKPFALTCMFYSFCSACGRYATRITIDCSKVGLLGADILGYAPYEHATMDRYQVTLHQIAFSSILSPALNIIFTVSHNQIVMIFYFDEWLRYFLENSCKRFYKATRISSARTTQCVRSKLQGTLLISPKLKNLMASSTSKSSRTGA